jgi:hypothetical protein
LYFLLKRKRKEIIVATIGRKAEHLASVYESVRNKKKYMYFKNIFCYTYIKNNKKILKKYFNIILSKK